MIKSLDKLIKSLEINQPVVLYASGTLFPSGNVDALQISFDPPRLTSNINQSLMTIQFNETVASGEYTLMVGGKYRDITRLIAIELIVQNNKIADINGFWIIFFIILSPTLIIILYFLIKKTKN